MDIIKVMILSSMFYMWFMPFLLAGALINMIKNMIEGKSSQSDFHMFGWTLFFIIIPFYCMLWHITEYL